jgi:uncharacterized protein YybS (DUF2232 family)
MFYGSPTTIDINKTGVIHPHLDNNHQFILAASSVTGADCVFGAFYRRKKSQLCPAQAIVATAHMIAWMVYFMLKNQVQYIPISANSFDKRYREQQIHYLHRRMDGI